MDKVSAPPFIIGIIGGGVAGMSCALWLKHLGFAPVIIEQHTKLGGQLLDLNRINRWVLGALDKTSVELALCYAEHVNVEAIPISYDAHLIAVSAKPTGYEVVIENADRTTLTFSVRALVIATGVKVLSHEIFGGIPGSQALFNAGFISFSPIGHIEKLAALNGKTVAVIGGGDNAHFTAKDVALAGAHTYLLMRSHSKARPAIRTEVKDLIAQGQITERTGTQITAFKEHQDRIEIVLMRVDGVTERIVVDMIFARTGFAANTEFLDAFDVFSGINKTAGYLVTDAAKRTSIPWVYAIGDVANPKHQSVVGAIADGAIAAQDLSERI